MKNILLVLLTLFFLASWDEKKEEKVLPVNPTELSVQQLKDSIVVKETVKKDVEAIYNHYVKLITNAQTWEELQSVNDSIKDIKKAFEKYGAKHQSYKKCFAKESNRVADSIQPIVEKRISELKPKQ